MIQLYKCHAFGGDRINFLHRDSYDLVPWIFDENSGDNAPMVLIVAEQCLPRVKALLLPVL